MASNSTVKKVIQVSEEAAPAVHMPVMVGNELFIMTQQDVRRVEDVRLLTYHRMSATGQLCPLTIVGADTAAPTFAGPDMAAMPMATGAHHANAQFCTLQDLVTHCQMTAQQQCAHITNDCADLEDEELDVPEETVASVATQLSWAKQYQSSKPFALRYSAATSTTALQSNTSTQHTSCTLKQSNSSQTPQARASLMHATSQTSNGSATSKEEPAPQKRSQSQQCSPQSFQQSCQDAPERAHGTASRRRRKRSGRTGNIYVPNPYYYDRDEATQQSLRAQRRFI